MTKRDYDPLQQLGMALGRVIAGTRSDKAAALAYLQASIANAALQGLVNLLVHKGVLTQAQVQESLDDAYDERFKQLAGSNGAELMPGATTKSN